MPELLPLPASRTELVFAEIRRAILARELLPGQPLVEAELAQRLGVSKTPVREALKLLCGSGLVTFNPYKGASVRVVDGELATHLYDVRLLLEPDAVRRTILNGNGAEVDEAGKALEAAEQVMDAGQYGELSLHNRAFHRALYGGCRNPLLIGVLDDLRDRAALINVSGLRTESSRERQHHEHQLILAAARSGDAKETVELLREHLNGLLCAVVAAIDAADVKPAKS